MRCSEIILGRLKFLCRCCLIALLPGNLFSAEPAASETPARDLANVFGVAHVDGKYYLSSEDFLDEGADQVLATGSKVIKLYLTPKRYPWNSDWSRGTHSLVEMARTPYFKSVFSKPFTTYILTAYSIGRSDHYWTLGMTGDEAKEETRQFHDLTAYLLTTYRGTGKTFILQHWEGDWALRSQSKKDYDPDYVPTATAIQGMIQWLNARQAGIIQARAEAGPTDVHVYGAAEANRLEDSMAGKPGVANSVLPYTTVDLASYSSYNFLDTPERLAQAVDYLAAHLPATAAFGQNPHSVYLGEFGYPENGPEGAGGVNRRINNALAVVNSKGLPWAVFWEIYCNEPLSKTPALPLNGKTNDLNLRGYWMVKPDGTPAVAWHRYRRFIIEADPQRATARAVKSKLTELFGEDFQRPDGTDLGTGWAKASHYGVVNEQLARHQLRFDIPDGRAIPWGSATLDLKNAGVLGRGLQVGDYFEITLRRLSEQGGLGVELFDSDQLRVGSDQNAGLGLAQAWNGTTWVPIAFDDRGEPVQIDWNQSHTLGVRFDSADGHRTTFSYYLDDRYLGSWLIATANRTLDKIGVYAQSRTGGAAFEFGGLKIYSGQRSLTAH